MNDFLLAQPSSVLRAHGAHRVFDAPGAAAAALRDGSADLIVGALPFDPQAPAALTQPERFEHTAGPWRPAAVPPLPPVRVVEQTPEPADHVARVRALVETLADPAQPLRKVVAARSVLAHADGDLEPETVAAHLLTRHPHATVFVADLSPAGRTGATLIGATPEVLVGRRGGTVSLRPLAGTLPRLADPDADAAQAADLLSSAKNREEHAFVIEWIREVLTPVCDELSIPSDPVLVDTPEVWHLATPITATLRDPGLSALDLALLLHPTPAVGGTPTPDAVAAILRDEADRGFYGGAVGWCDSGGDGEWLVSIRCAELSADHRTVRAFAGGGIVAASDPSAELDETTAKLGTFLRALDCAAPAADPTGISGADRVFAG